MSAIDFVVRTGAGNVQRGVVDSGAEQSTIQGGPGREISLNLAQTDLRGYFRDGDKLVVTLADGRIIVIDDYFADNGVAVSRLFLSTDGALNEVSFDGGDDGVLFASYGPTDAWGKWSPDDDLVFLDRPEVVSAEALAAEGDNVSMLAAGLLGGGGVTRLLAGGAAVGVTAAVLGGAGDGGGSGGGGGTGGGGGGGGGTVTPITPTLDTPAGEVTIGGDDSEAEQTVTVTGTGEAGSDVTVTIGDQTVTTTIDADGTWEATFEGETFPEDGTHTIDVDIVDSTGTNHDLTGPEVVIDTTPPPVDSTDGTVSINDLTNAEDYSDGVEVAGTGEAGATVEITANGVTHTTTVDSTGQWSVVFATGELPEGELTVPVTIVTTDSFGNSTTVEDSIEIDTVPHPITINWETVTGDGIVNNAENSAGFAVTGTSTPGAIMTVTVGGYSGSATVGADGSWTLNVPGGEMPGGEYDVTVTASTVDAAGNASSHTETIRIDTINQVTISANPIEGDDVVNGLEAQDGFMVTGATQPGATVMVTMGTVTLPATVAADGSWTVNFSASDVAPGEYDAEITVISTDAAGNSATAMRTIHVDTITDVALDTTLVGDGIVNQTEAQMGVPVTGTSQPGNSIEMSFNGTTYTGMTGADGTWTIVVPAAGIAPGTYTAPIQITATDAHGNVATTSGTLDIDTEGSVTVATATVETDGTINNAERADGVTLTGTTEPGSTVNVTVGGVTLAATVDAAGNWTADFPASAFPTGETTASVTAVAVDAAGNSSTATGTVDVDTFVRNHEITSTTGGADQVVNGAEAASGLVFSGTTEPGSTVMVEFGGVTLPASVAANGSWTVNFPPNAIAAGTYTGTVTATATDPAGNTDVATSTVSVDTQVDNLSITDSPVETDDVVNMVEASDGVTLTGTVEPGASVMVTFAGVTMPATVDAAGNWSVSYAAGQIAGGEYPTSVDVAATDAAGNTASVTRAVEIDTFVNLLETTGGPVTGDDVINNAEAAAGVTLTGVVEPGSTVMVTFEGTQMAANVDAAGNWSITVPDSAIPDGQYDTDVLIDATDAAGNTAQITQTISVDTVAPDAAQITTYTEDFAGNVLGISVAASDDAQDVLHVQADGSISPVSHTQVDIAALDRTSMFFDTPVPDGSHLVVTTEDDAGNNAGTYLVLDETGNQSVNVTNPNLGTHNIESIDLQFADESELTITPEQLAALSSNSNTLTVYGGADDQVTISGATHVGQVTENGQTFNVYDLGDGTVRIEEDVTNVVI